MAKGLHRGIPRSFVLLAGVLATLCVWAALYVPSESVSSASASPFCGGQTRSNYAYCHGAARTLSGVNGQGVQRSVCVGASVYWGGCSSGPGHIVTMNLGFTAYLGPWIQVNAAGSTVLYGNTF